MPKQYAALPFKISQSDMQVMLITTRRKGRWSVPKGTVRGVQDPRRIAAIEAFEEAGVKGIVAKRSIGRFRHQKTKGKRRFKMNVSVYPMQVEKVSVIWPEMRERDAIWLSVDEAAALVHKRRLRLLIRRFARRSVLRAATGAVRPA